MVKFGAFIITYNRPILLLDTISIIFSQSFPPEFIWVIDNSEDFGTNKAVVALFDSRVKYCRMGFNAGPAGAAAKGLELCTRDGADWIYWGDDNDPPFNKFCFEKLLAIRDVNPFCGVLGAVGHFFDRKKGVIKRIQTRLLEKKSWIEVDSIAGNMCMLVNSEVVKSGITPNPDLFFGFEELEFCLKVSRKGYSLVVDSSLFLLARQGSGRLEFDRPIYNKKENLAREYYSLRNLLYISDSLTLSSMKRNLMKKWFFKMFYGFRFGVGYGLKNFQMIAMAYYHYFRGITGKTIPL